MAMDDAGERRSMPPEALIRLGEIAECLRVAAGEDPVDLENESQDGPPSAAPVQAEEPIRLEA